MAASLLVLPTLERLHPHDDSAGKKLGLSFSVALSSAQAPKELGTWKAFGASFLQPWSWRANPQVPLRSGTTPRFLPIEWICLFGLSGEKTQLVRAQGVPGRLKKLEEKLLNRFQHFDSFGWDSTTTEVSRETRPWPAFLAQVSLYPWPLPQSLGLSFLLDYADDLGENEIVAAPVLRLQLDGGPIELPPAFLERSGSEVVLEYRWPDSDPHATDPARPAIQARTAPCLVDKALSSPYFDFKTLWVGQQEKDVTSVDWRAGLEARVAEQLNLARVIVDWMKMQEKKPAQYPELAYKALQQLHLTLGPGTRKKSSFLRQARSFFKTEYSREVAESVQSVAQGWSVSDEQWLRWLREILSGAPNAEGNSASLLDLAVDKQPATALARLSLDQTLAALDQILAHAATPAVTRAIFKRQWQAIAADKSASWGDEKARAFAGDLASELPEEVDLQRLLLLDRLAESWGDLVKSVFAGSPSRKDIGQRLRASFKKILQDTFALPQEDFKDAVDTMASRVLPEDFKNLDTVKGTQGLTLQVDTLGRPEQGDFLEHMQGVALLMRKEKEESWHCLNLAAVEIDGEVLCDPVLLPSRLSYAAGLRVPTVTYDNTPLTVGGPLSPKEISGAEIHDNKEEQPIDQPLVDFTYSKKGTIPGLVFGENYQLLPFLVTNSGAIPKGIAEKGDPRQLKKVIKNADVVLGKPVAAPYKRQAPVGSLRFSPKNSERRPPAPAGVAPWIRDLAPVALLPANDPVLRKNPDGLGTDAALAGLPLALLAAPGMRQRAGIEVPSTFQFEINVPTVDLETWHRWVAKSVEKDRRKFILRSYYQLAYEAGGDPRAKDLMAAKVYLDDPAVDHLWYEIVSFADDGTTTTKGPLQCGPADGRARAVSQSFSNWDKDPLSLKTEQRDSIPVTCSAMSEDRLTVKVGSADPVTVSGRRHRLSFYADLGGAWDRFERDENVRPPGSPRGTSPWHLLIEIAGPLIPQKNEEINKLKSALGSGFKAAAQSGTIDIGLDLSRHATLGRHVHRAELWHQVWSWRGRPRAKHPDLDPKGESPTLLGFEMAEFGARSDAEHRRLWMTPNPDPKTRTQKAFVYQEKLGAQGEVDARALHHRFSVRAYSRYEGILPEEESFVDSTFVLGDPAPGESRWTDLFMPCRFHGVVPIPKVKLVLPLTQGSSDEEGPGLLVVVDGPWHEVGGLAEQLEAEVMLAADPEDLAKSDGVFLEAGTDPIVTQESALLEVDRAGGKNGALRDDTFVVQFDRIDGAIGHQRDNSPTTPRFLASSFLLSRPTIRRHGKDAPALPVNLSWWFLKLRFRRTLQTETGMLRSDVSAPFWVQLLPEVDRVEGEWFATRPEAMEIRLEGDKLRVTAGAQGHSAAPFYLFGVMTRRVVDFGGRPDQEAYLGVWWPDGDHWSTGPSEAPTAGTGDLFIRWIRVQCHGIPEVKKSDDLWHLLFDPDLLDAKRARIVQISRRFPLQSEGRS